MRRKIIVRGVLTFSSSPEPSSRRIGAPSSPSTGRPSASNRYSLSSDRSGSFPLRPFGSLIALLLHAGDFLLPFLK